MEIKKKQSRISNLWAPPIIWAGVIFLFSCLPTTRTTEIYWQDFIIKKTAHMIEYGILTIFLYRGFKESGISKKRAAVYSILLAAFYGATDEFHQSFTPGREPRARDVIFDTIGSILSIYAIWKLLPKAPKRLKNWAKNWQLL